MGVNWREIGRAVEWYETHNHSHDTTTASEWYIRLLLEQVNERKHQMALQNATAFVAPPKMEYLSPTVLYNRAQPFYLYRVRFENRANPDGQVVMQALADVFNCDGENIGKMATGARYVVEALQAFCETEKSPELIGPLRMEKGERAYFLVPDTGEKIPF